MECIVHFEVVHHGTDEIAKLRGLVMTPDKEKPTVDDVQEMLRMMGYEVHCTDEAALRFEPDRAGTDVEEIRIKKVDMGEEVYTPDMQLRAIAEQLMSKPNRSI
ncbi:hypothetical protein SAMN04488689_104263 [Paenibacillus sp. cl6col]|uniref:dipeptidyl aminopeptidase n=1 Tax=Paenibacillus sp. cl6col TaxID=1761878 RepID=UPI0008878B8C|nr:dipeptidyl aminopeptidase [Paenibacillus sp. cl6col]SDF30714.1 hypothetical protein SAMN04488689_104263 [Paenibacillus sp. cl6col]